MHGQHRDAGIDGLDVAVCHVTGDRAAAALVDLAELAGLPDDVVLRKDAAHIAHDLSGCVGAAGLAARAGILEDAGAVVDLRVVRRVAGLGIQRVKRVADVCGQAERMLEAAALACARRLAQVLHEHLEILALHAGDADGADLLLVGQHAHGRLDRGAEVQQRLEGGIGAYAVVMAVGGDEAAVEANLTRRACGDHGQLGGEEVLLRQAVLLVQEHEDGELHAVCALVVLQRAAAEQDAQVLARHALGQRLAHLLLAFLPIEYNEDAFPYSVVKYGIISFNTSVFIFVVALLSKYIISIISISFHILLEYYM